MKIALVCTQGGHLTEMLQILDAFSGRQIFFVTHNSSRNQEILKIAPAYFSNSIDAKLNRFLSSFVSALMILKKEEPDVMVSMGAEIAIPFFFWSKILGIKTIYIESWCRSENLSITGKIVYYWVDEFWVQWPQLCHHYPKAKYNGSVV
jgi:beta-1,4-N-acetylglucosaminyltransferase